MKIAVYTIAKNEEKFVQTWYDSCRDADYLLVTDTGSVDQTIKKLCQYKDPKLNINTVTINPWRFDDARNFSLMSLPNDIDVCICLDMDEILVHGWRDIVEKYWIEGTDRLRYNYIWSWNDDCTPGVTYHADKIHTRHGFRWVNPVHEVLVKDSRLETEKQVFISETLIEHYPDNSKSRSNYLPLLELAVRENPMNDRNAHYYARELMFDEQYDKAISQFVVHLDLPSAKWSSERAASLRYMGDCYWALGKKQSAIACFKKAIEESPREREPYIALAQAYRAISNWDGVIDQCVIALSITERPNTYINQPSSWSSWPNDMLEEAQEKLKWKK